MTSMGESRIRSAKPMTDTAAVTYITWKRGMRWYVLRYVWAAVGAKGESCDRRRTPAVNARPSIQDLDRW